MTSFPPDTIQTLVAGGTGALILALIIAVTAFALGKVRPGSDSETWRKIAQESAAALARQVPVQESQAQAIKDLTDAVQRLTSMAELRHQEADLRRELERRSG